MRLVDQTGSLQIDYKVRCKQIAGDEFAQVELHIALPGQNFEFKDLVTEISKRSYKENLRIALLKAEERWGLELRKLEINAIA